MAERFRRSSPIVSLVCGCALLAAQAQAQTSIQFDIPAQALEDALRELGKTGNINILIDRKLVSGIRAPALNARMSVDEAISQLLDGTQLTYEFIDAHTVMLTPVQEASQSSATDGQRHSSSVSRRLPSAGLIRLAQADTASSSGASPTASAQSSATPAGDSLDEVIVTSRRFIDSETTGATRLPLPIHKVPQSVSLVSQDFIEVADLSTLNSLADYSVGINSPGPAFGFYTNLRSRGFDLDAAQAFRVNGYKFFQQYEFAPDIVDRVEIVRGPSSVVYGMGSPGGVVNSVLKRAGQTPAGKMRVGFGRWSNVDALVEYGGPVNDDGTVRAFGLAHYDGGDSFINHVRERAAVGYGRLDVDFTDELSLSLSGAVSDRKNLNTDGAPLFSSTGADPRVPRDLFIGNTETNDFKQGAIFAIGELTWRPSADLTLGLATSYERITEDLAFAYAFGLDDEGNTEIYSEWSRDTHYNVLDVEAKAQYNFELFGQSDNMLLASVNFDRIHAKWPLAGDFLFNGEFAPVVNVFSGQAAIDSVLSNVTREPSYKDEYQQQQKVAAVQALLKPTEKLGVLAGVSVNKVEYSSGWSAPNTPNPQTTTTFPSETSTRLGLTYEFLPNWTGYAAFSDSFSPQAALGIDDRPLEPLTGTQYEVGVKARTPGGRALFTVALYSIDQDNIAALIPGVDPERYRELGTVRHQGVEVEFVGELLPGWSLLANADYLDAKVERSEDPAEEGLRRVFIPELSASMFTTYELADGALRGLGFGGGVRHVGDQKTTLFGATEDLKGYTVVDAVVYYKWDAWEARLNFENLFDEDYRLSSFQTIEYGARPGTPRSYALTLTRRL